MQHKFAGRQRAADAIQGFVLALDVVLIYFLWHRDTAAYLRSFR